MICSTIIPTVGRDTLERAVLSALEQGLGPDEHEIIVVNDGGKPLAPADWQASPQVRVIETNRSERSLACNVGAAVARGTYVKFLHDDDYILPDGLKTLLAVAERAPDDCVWIYGALNRVDNDNQFMSVDRPGPEVSGNIFSLFVAQECLHVAPAILNRRLFLRAGGFDPRLAMREDLDLESRLALTGTFARTDAVVAAVRVGETGSTSDWSRFRETSFFVRERTLSLPGAVRRIKESLGSDPYLRGRVCRAYLLTALMHTRQWNGLTALSRVLCGLRLSGVNFFVPRFWHGFAHPRLFGRPVVQKSATSAITNSAAG